MTRHLARVVGRDGVTSPLENTWDSFFLVGPAVTDDFLPQRAEQAQPPRESLEEQVAPRTAE